MLLNILLILSFDPDFGELSRTEALDGLILSNFSVHPVYWHRQGIIFFDTKQEPYPLGPERTPLKVRLSLYGLPAGEDKRPEWVRRPAV